MNGVGYLSSPPIKIEEQIDVINSPGSSDTRSPAPYINGYPQSSSGYLTGNTDVMPGQYYNTLTCAFNVTFVVLITIHNESYVPCRCLQYIAIQWQPLQ